MHLEVELQIFSAPVYALGSERVKMWVILLC